MKFQKSIILFLALVMCITPISAFASTTNDKNAQIDELAEALDFMFNEAMIKDENGKMIGLDFEKIENKYGKIQEVEELKKQTVESSSMSVFDGNDGGGEYKLLGEIGDHNRKVDKCIMKRIEDGYKEFLAVAGATTIYELIKKGHTKKAAELIIKAGFRSNLIGLAATLGYIFTTCQFYPDEYLK